MAKNIDYYSAEKFQVGDWAMVKKEVIESMRLEREKGITYRGEGFRSEKDIPFGLTRDHPYKAISVREEVRGFWEERSGLLSLDDEDWVEYTFQLIELEGCEGNFYLSQLFEKINSWKR